MSILVYEPLEAVLEVHFWGRDLDADESIFERYMHEAGKTVGQH